MNNVCYKCGKFISSFIPELCCYCHDTASSTTTNVDKINIKYKGENYMNKKKLYNVKITCEYYVDIIAETEGEALNNAIGIEYDSSDFQNFKYEISNVDELSEDDIKEHKDNE